MNVSIDNFQTIRDKVLVFDNPGDFYFVTILRRRKDHKGPMASGVNEGCRLIKWFEVSSKEYLESKYEDIRKLCSDNGARAYINPQRRNRRDVLWHLHDNVSEMLKQGNSSVKIEALVRRSVASCHTSDRKRWMIDIDIPATGESIANEVERDEIRDKAQTFLKDKIREIHTDTDHKTDFDWIAVPTPNGLHIVTEPFNLQLYSILHGEWLKSGNPLMEIIPTAKDGVKQDALMLMISPCFAEDPLEEQEGKVGEEA